MIQIIHADVIDGLKQLPDESVQCVVTSPPYWGLRDYGVDGKLLGLHYIGFEKNSETFNVAKRRLEQTPLDLGYYCGGGQA